MGQLIKQITALLQRGLEHHQAGELERASLIYKRVLAAYPGHFDALHLLGVIAAQSGEFELAVDLISRAIKINTGHAQAYFNLGNALKAVGRLDDALSSFDSALSINPNLAEASNARGGVLKVLGRLSEALVSFESAVSARPHFFEALNNLGLLLIELRRPMEALIIYDSIIKDRQSGAEVYFNRGVTLKALGRFDDALSSYDCAIAINPDYAEAINNRGVLLKMMGRLEEALDCYSAATALQPNHAEFVTNFANTLRELGRLEEALVHYKHAILVRPGYVEALLNQGVALQELRRFDEALASYARAIDLDQGRPEAFNNKGGVLQELREFDLALGCYEQAIRIRPDYIQPHLNRASVLHELMRPDEAFYGYNHAYSIDPNFDFLGGLRLHSQMRLCDWNGFDSHLGAIEDGIREGRAVASPFSVLTVLDNPELQNLSAQIFINTNKLGYLQNEKFRMPPVEQKIRVGYFSADFYSHATSYLIAELFEAHDPERFEVYGFSFGPNADDQMYRRIKAGFHRFYDVSNKSDLEIALISRDIGIEIAFDLKGFTQGARSRIFAARCAPIQVNFLGFPGTMGASFMDYIIADPIVIPPQSRSFYTEKIVYLPTSYQVNDSTRLISDHVLHRRDFGLPESAFVFCCFNNTYKILPDMFDVWMRLLLSVEGSVFWLLEDNLIAASNLRREATARGIDPVRLVFAKRLPNAEHLARHRLADLFLDTFPCNAHTTMSDALWSGLPALTLLGKSFAARVAASLIFALGLSELVAETYTQYETRAIELAKNPGLLAGVRGKLASMRRTSPLFDGKRFARDLETALVMMSGRYRSGQDPDHLVVGV